MDTVPESDLPVRPPVECEDVGLGEYGLVAVCGTEQEQDRFIGPHYLSMKLDLCRQGAREALDGGVEAKKFLNG